MLLQVVSESLGWDLDFTKDDRFKIGLHFACLLLGKQSKSEMSNNCSSFSKADNTRGRQGSCFCDAVLGMRWFACGVRSWAHLGVPMRGGLGRGRGQSRSGLSHPSLQDEK